MALVETTYAERIKPVLEEVLSDGKQHAISGLSRIVWERTGLGRGHVQNTLGYMVRKKECERLSRGVYRACKYDFSRVGNSVMRLYDKFYEEFLRDMNKLTILELSEKNLILIHKTDFVLKECREKLQSVFGDSDE